MPEEINLPSFMLKNYKRYGDNVAMRVKDRGIWNEITWSEYFLSVKEISLGLMSLGLEKSDKIAVIGENSPEYYWIEVAALCCRAVVLGIYADSKDLEIEYIINDSGAKFVFAEDQEQVDKMLEIKDSVPVEKVIYWDERGL